MTSLGLLAVAQASVSTRSPAERDTTARAEYLLGDKLLERHVDAENCRRKGISDHVRTAHKAAAGGVAAAFGINTITGLWNLYDSRDQPEGRSKRLAHTVLMLASDAGFAAAGLVAGRATSHAADAHAPQRRAGLHGAGERRHGHDVARAGVTTR